MAALKVLGRKTSINVRKVHWLLDEMEVEYEREDWGMPLRDPKVPEFLALNPNGQVPVIVEEGFVLWESNAILAYLAERHASGLMPVDVRERALVLQWLCWQASELNPAWSYVFSTLVRRTAEPEQQRLAAGIAAWGAKMAVLEGQLAQTGAHVAGERISIADIAIGLSVHRWFETPFDKPELPHVAGYYERLRQRPAAVPHMGKETP